MKICYLSPQKVKKRFRKVLDPKENSNKFIPKNSFSLPVDEFLANKKAFNSFQKRISETMNQQLNKNNY